MGFKGYPTDNTGLVTLNTPRGPVGWWIVYVPLMVMLIIAVVVHYLPVLRIFFFGSFLPAAVIFAHMIGVQ